jgi:PAS domain S-box-containing protein
MVRCGTALERTGPFFALTNDTAMDNRVRGVTDWHRRLAKNPANSPVRRAADGSHHSDTTHADDLSFPQALMAEAPGVVVEHLSEGLLIVDTASQLIYWNPAALKLYGFASPEAAVQGLPDLPKMFELATLDGKALPPEDWPLMRIMRGETLCDLELKIRCLQPEWSRIFRYSGSRVSYTGPQDPWSGPQDSWASRRSLAFLTVNDITEKKKIERELERVNRLNVARSRVNQAIVRTRDRKTLFRRVCQILVEEGGFGMAWIGWRSARTQQLVPMAQWDEEGEFTSAIEVYTDDRPEGRGPSGTAFREGVPYICNDAFNDPSTLPWRAEFERRGLLASAAFPIHRSGRIRGILSVYAREVGFFRDKEIALVEEVAADLTFALDHIANEAVRRRAQELASRERLLSADTIESLPGTFYLYDESGRFLRWNRNFATVTGYSDEEIARMHPLDFFIGKDRERVGREIGVVFERGESSIEADFIAKDGTSKAYFFTGKRIDFRGLRCLIGMGIDISVRKSAEAAMDQYARWLRATSHRLLTVQEAERRSLARELHDAVGQELTALSLNLTIIDAALPDATPPKVHERIEDSQEILEGTTRHLRNIMTELRPPGLDELGLLAALQEHAGQVGRRAEVRVTVAGVEPQPRLGPSEEIALFRIVQEALNNVVKHAQASAASISLQQGNGIIALNVTDDGRGFDTARKPVMGAYGMGTTTMRERAEAIGAQLSIDSAPGAGTRITVELNWPPQAPAAAPGAPPTS